MRLAYLESVAVSLHKLLSLLFIGSLLDRPHPVSIYLKTLAPPGHNSEIVWPGANLAL